MKTSHYYDLNRRPLLPDARYRWPSSDRLLAALMLGTIIGVLLFWSGLQVSRWWHDRVEPAQQVLGETIMPPVNSTMNTALVDWVMKRGAADREFAQFVVTKTFEYSTRRQVDPLLMLALISVESKFDPMARSPAGAMGLTQIIPRWHEEKVNVVHVYDPAVNIAVGVEILHEYTQRQRGDMTRALLQYNGSLQVPGAYAFKVKAARAQLAAFTMFRIIRG